MYLADQKGMVASTNGLIAFWLLLALVCTVTKSLTSIIDQAGGGSE
jgi:hypothetical protein